MLGEQQLGTLLEETADPDGVVVEHISVAHTGQRGKTGPANDRPCFAGDREIKP